MEPDEQECKSIRYNRGALVVPLSSGRFGVCTKWHEFVGVYDEAELPSAIRFAHTLSIRTHAEALQPIIKAVRTVIASHPRPVGNPDDLGL